MATNGIWQLEKLTIRYCQYGGSSRFLRDMLKHTKFLTFVKENPQIEFKTIIKGAKHPILIGEYVNNKQKVIDVKNKEIEDVMKFIHTLRNSSGRKMTALKKPIVSENPTIQGIWQYDIKYPTFTVQ